MESLDTLAKVAEIFTPVASVILLGWWLRGQFFLVRDHASKNLAEHERSEFARFGDMERVSREQHLQNLRRFSILGIALTRIKPDLDLRDLNNPGGG